MIDTIKLEELLNSEFNDVLSIYLNIDPSSSDGGRAPSLIWLKSAFKELKEKIEPSKKNYLETIEDEAKFLIEGALFKDKSIILFLGKDIKELMPTQVAVENEISFGKPNLGQLIWIIEEYRPFGVLMVDSNMVEIYKIYLNKIEKIQSFNLDLDTSDWRKQRLMPPSSPRDGPARGSVGGGDRVEAFEDRIEANQLRFMKKAISYFNSIAKEHSIKEFVLSGSEDIYEKYFKLLSKEQMNMIVGNIPIPIDTNPKNIRDQSLSLFWNYERAREKTLVENLLERSSVGILACVGLDSTLKSLQASRVDRVVISRAHNQNIRKCLKCNYHEMINEKPCSICNSPDFIEGSSKSFLPPLVLSFGAKMEVVGNGAGKKLMAYGGVGAFWRY
ncbi:MAG: hypothetical protein DDT22_00995 [candidate division WS2 bacterium]|nr:hypothetical protein [Candidatus Lithacetigena glycinireducens]MBT9175320.1 hypothetical protein [Candidatus Lithacetigena glycinireducens]